MWYNSHEGHIPDIYSGEHIDKLYDETNHKVFWRLFFNTLFRVIMLFNESNDDGKQGSEGLVQDS